MNGSPAHHPRNTESPGIDRQQSSRWWVVAIMGVLLLWGLYLALGAFLPRHNVWQGGLVLACVLAYLLFWAVMLATRGTRSTLKKTTGDESTQLSKLCVAGFSATLIGLLLTIAALLFVPKTSLGDAVVYGSLLLISMGWLSAVVGLSNPRPAVGKKLGMSTFPLSLVWLVAAVFYIAA